MPEMAIAEDFKRLLSAFTPDKRKAIGKELSSLLAGVSSASSSHKRSMGEKGTTDNDEARIGMLQVEIAAQEKQIEHLKRQIEQLESGQSRPRKSTSGSTHAAQDATAVEQMPQALDEVGGLIEVNVDKDEGEAEKI